MDCFPDCSLAQSHCLWTMSRLSVLAPCEIMTSLLSLFLPLLRLKQNCKMFCLGRVVLFKSPGCSYLWIGHVLTGGCVHFPAIVTVLIWTLALPATKFALPFKQQWNHLLSKNL